jgi:ribosomal protein S2
MKIKKISNNKNKLLKLKILQTKIYNKKHYSENIGIEEIEYRLKKILNIIYKYNTSNKSILFLGIPININKLKKLTKNSKHTFISSNLYIKGTLQNKKSFTNKISKLLSKKNIDLIVIFDETSNIDIINEGYITKIPTVTLNSDLNIQFKKPSYKVPGNFNFSYEKSNILNKIHNHFLYSLLITTLNKTNV